MAARETDSPGLDALEESIGQDEAAIRERHDALVADPKAAVAMAAKAELRSKQIRGVSGVRSLHVSARDASLMHALSRVGADASAAGTSFGDVVSHQSFIEGLRHRFSGPRGTKGTPLVGGAEGGFSWVDLGAELGGFTRIPPALCFLSGVLGIAPVAKKQAQRQPRARAAEASTAPVLRHSHVKDLAAGESASAKRQEDLMNDLSTLLATAPKVRLADGKKGRRLHLLRTLVDPWSLTQTVEHMFHFAGIVAVHQARVELGSDGEAYIAVGTLRRGTGGRDALDDEAKDLDAEGHLENLGGTKQCVLDMDRELWSMAIKAYGIEAPALPHRKTDDSTAPPGLDFASGAISVAGLDVSMRSTGAAVVQVVLGGSGAARTEGLRWKVPELGTVPAKPGASILETGAAIAKRAEHLGGVSRGPELRMPLHGCAIEGFMQSFVAGRFRTQSLFLLAQLNGLAANALWDVGGAPPLVLMPNAVRALLLVPTLSECEKEEEALYRALGREPPPPPDPGAASAALKRAVLRRIAMMDQDAAWPVRGPSAASASVTDLVRRHSPPGAEATQRRRLEALLLLTESVSDEAFDMADAAGVATAAALNAIGVLTATSSPSLKLALARHRQARSASAEDEQALLDVEPDARALGSPCCRQEGLDGPPCAGRRAAEIGALIARHGTKASVAALGAADAETRVRLCAALGAAWLKALAQAGDTARAGHGKLPTGWKPGAGTEPDAGSEAECPRCKHVGMSLGALGAWPWGGVSPALAKATIDNLSAAVAKAANAKTRQSSRLGLKQPDVELLGPIVAGLRLGATAAASAALAAPFLRPWARFHGDGGGFLAFTQDDGVVPKEARKVILWGAAVNVALGALKVGVGSAAGSSALVADGVHSVSDIVSDVVTLAAMRVARLPPDENHLFGHGRVEAIGTLGVSGLLLMASGGIAVHAYSAAQALLPGLRGEGAALAAPDSSAGAALAEVAAAAADGSASLDPALSAAFVAAVVGIAAKEWLFRWTAAVAERVSSSTLLANAWHHRSDAFSSVVAAAGVGGALAGLPLVDPVGGLVVAAMIAKQGVDMGVGALRELSDEAADPSTTAAVQQALLDAAPGEILSVRRLRTRVLGHYVAAEAEIGVNPATTLTSANALARVAEAHVRRQCPRVADLSVAVGPHICDGAAGTAARGSGADGTAGDPSGGAVARQQHASPSQVPRRLPGKVEDDIVSHVIRAVPAVRRVTHLRLHFLPGGRRCTAEMEIELRDFSQTLHDACMVAASARRAAELVHEVVRADVHIEVRDDGKRQR